MTSDFSATRALFHLPEGVIYLDGNSLGPLPRAAASRIAACVTQEWGDMLIGGWNKAGWMDQPARLGDRIARLIGATPGSVVLGDTLSIKVWQALAAALELRPGRRVILSDTGNFPSDLYMADGLVRTLGAGHELRTVAPEAVGPAISDDLAVLMLTEVDYRTGRKHDMASLITRAHAAGALVVWDLAHSAGAIPVDLAGAGADFAVGCTYKYLNSGPGGPAFIYVAPHLADRVRPAPAHPRRSRATRHRPGRAGRSHAARSRSCGWRDSARWSSGAGRDRACRRDVRAARARTRHASPRWICPRLPFRFRRR